MPDDMLAVAQKAMGQLHWYCEWILFICAAIEFANVVQN